MAVDRSDDYHTCDGVEITAGLKVTDYDRRPGVIGARQFERKGVCDPGGVFWLRGWYEVEYENGSVRRFNGTRMISRED